MVMPRPARIFLRRRRQARAIAVRAIFHPATPSVTRSEGAASSQPSCKTGIIHAIPSTAEKAGSLHPESAVAWARAEATPQPQGRVGRSGVRFSSPAAKKQQKNMTRARRVEMPIPVSCAYTIRIHCGNSGAQSNRKPYFFKSPNSPAPIRDRCSRKLPVDG